jgi:hypothetical protein
MHQTIYPLVSTANIYLFYHVMHYEHNCLAPEIFQSCYSQIFNTIITSTDNNEGGENKPAQKVQKAK